MSEVNIKPINVAEELSKSFLEYSMSVIISRALPDVRDGLKPSQRRILYAMHELSLFPGRKHYKCAKICGDTSGNYHPHGEAVIYPTLVRMAQEWNMRHVLIDKQGNFGSLAGMPPAAMRYTEARLAPIARLLLDFASDDNGDKIEKPLTHQTIAQMIGASRETVSRTLRHLVDRDDAAVLHENPADFLAIPVEDQARDFDLVDPVEVGHDAADQGGEHDLVGPIGRLAELAKEQGSVWTQMVDGVESVVPSWTPLGYAIRAVTTDSAEHATQHRPLLTRAAIRRAAMPLRIATCWAWRAWPPTNCCSCSTRRNNGSN